MLKRWLARMQDAGQPFDYYANMGLKKLRELARGLKPKGDARTLLAYRLMLCGSVAPRSEYTEVEKEELQELHQQKKVTTRLWDWMKQLAFSLSGACPMDLRGELEGLVGRLHPAITETMPEFALAG